jgi:hypothetical protein
MMTAAILRIENCLKLPQYIYLHRFSPAITINCFHAKIGSKAACSEIQDGGSQHFEIECRLYITSELVDQSS